MLKLVELVKVPVKDESKGTRGTVINYGCRKNCPNYLDIFAIFMRKHSRIVSGESVQVEEVATLLLSLSLTAKRGAYGESESSHAISFKATTHVRKMEHVFKYYHISIHNWAVCQIADSCNINKSIAFKMKVPHVGCLSHIHVLDVNLMLNSEINAVTAQLQNHGVTL